MRQRRRAWGYLTRYSHHPDGDDRPVAPPISLVSSHVVFGRGGEPPAGELQAMLGLEAAAPSNGPSSPSSRVRSGQDMLLVQWLGVEDDRVSRLHATIQVHWGTGRRPPLVSIEDHSRNGTFLNGVPLAPGRPTVLDDGDRISLVLSVNPLSELSYVYEQSAVPWMAAVASPLAAAAAPPVHVPSAPAVSAAAAAASGTAGWGSITTEQLLSPAGPSPFTRQSSQLVSQPASPHVEPPLPVPPILTVVAAGGRASASGNRSRSSSVSGAVPTRTPQPSSPPGLQPSSCPRSPRSPRTFAAFANASASAAAAAVNTAAADPASPGLPPRSPRAPISSARALSQPLSTRHGEDLISGPIVMPRSVSSQGPSQPASRSPSQRSSADGRASAFLDARVAELVAATAADSFFVFQQPPPQEQQQPGSVPGDIAQAARRVSGSGRGGEGAGEGTDCSTGGTDSQQPGEPRRRQRAAAVCGPPLGHAPAAHALVVAVEDTGNGKDRAGQRAVAGEPQSPRAGLPPRSPRSPRYTSAASSDGGATDAGARSTGSTSSSSRSTLGGAWVPLAPGADQGTAAQGLGQGREQQLYPQEQQQLGTTSLAPSCSSPRHPQDQPRASPSLFHRSGPASPSPAAAAAAAATASSKPRCPSRLRYTSTPNSPPPACWRPATAPAAAYADSPRAPQHSVSMSPDADVAFRPADSPGGSPASYGDTGESSPPPSPLRITTSAPLPFSSSLSAAAQPCNTRQRTSASADNHNTPYDAGNARVSPGRGIAVFGANRHTSRSGSSSPSRNSRSNSSSTCHRASGYDGAAASSESLPSGVGAMTPASGPTSWHNGRGAHPHSRGHSHTNSSGSRTTATSRLVHSGARSGTSSVAGGGRVRGPYGSQQHLYDSGHSSGDMEMIEEDVLFVGEEDAGPGHALDQLGSRGSGSSAGSTSWGATMCRRRQPNRRLTRYGECLDTPSPCSLASPNGSGGLRELPSLGQWAREPSLPQHLPLPLPLPQHLPVRGHPCPQHQQQQQQLLYQPAAAGAGAVNGVAVGHVTLTATANSSFQPVGTVAVGGVGAAAAGQRTEPQHNLWACPESPGRLQHQQQQQPQQHRQQGATQSGSGERVVAGAPRSNTHSYHQRDPLPPAPSTPRTFARNLTERLEVLAATRGTGPVDGNAVCTSPSPSASQGGMRAGTGVDEACGSGAGSCGGSPARFHSQQQQQQVLLQFQQHPQEQEQQHSQWRQSRGWELNSGGTSWCSTPGRHSGGWYDAVQRGGWQANGQQQQQNAPTAGAASPPRSAASRITPVQPRSPLRRALQPPGHTPAMGRQVYGTGTADAPGTWPEEPASPTRSVRSNCVSARAGAGPAGEVFTGLGDVQVWVRRSSSGAGAGAGVGQHGEGEESVVGFDAKWDEWSDSSGEARGYVVVQGNAAVGPGAQRGGSRSGACASGALGAEHRGSLGHHHDLHIHQQEHVAASEDAQSHVWDGCSEWGDSHWSCGASMAEGYHTGGQAGPELEQEQGHPDGAAAVEVEGAGDPMTELLEARAAGIASGRASQRVSNSGMSPGGGRVAAGAAIPPALDTDTGGDGSFSAWAAAAAAAAARYGGGGSNSRRRSLSRPSSMPSSANSAAAAAAAAAARAPAANAPDAAPPPASPRAPAASAPAVPQPPSRSSVPLPPLPFPMPMEAAAVPAVSAAAMPRNAAVANGALPLPPVAATPADPQYGSLSPDPRVDCCTPVMPSPKSETRRTPLTTRYTGAAGDTRALTCGLCGGGLCAAVALQPCGHSFCATCLSHHLAAAMVAGGRLRCPESGCTARDLDLIVINRPARALERLMYGTADLAAEYDTPYDRSPAGDNDGSGAECAEPHGHYHHAEDPEEGNHLGEQEYRYTLQQQEGGGQHLMLGGHRRRADTGVHRSGSFAPGHGDPSGGPSPFMRAYLAAHASAEDGPAVPTPAASATQTHSPATRAVYELPGTSRDRWGGEGAGGRSLPRRSLSEARFPYLHMEEGAATGPGQGAGSAAGSGYTRFEGQGRSREPVGRCHSTSAVLGSGGGTFPAPVHQEARTPPPAVATPREGGWGGRDSRIDDGGGVVGGRAGSRRGPSSSSLPPAAPAPPLGFSCPPSMHDLVPLSDGELPLPASRLHVRQGEELLSRMQGLLEAAAGGEEAEREAAGGGGRREALGPELAAAAQERCLTLLGALARLAGGSPEVRDSLRHHAMLQACLAAMRGPWQQVHPTATSTATTTTSRSSSTAACYTAAAACPASSSSTLGTPFSTTGIAAAHVHSGPATGSERAQGAPPSAPYGPTPYPLLHSACRTLAALLTPGEDRTALMQWALAKMGGAEVLLGVLERGAGIGQKLGPEGEEQPEGVVARLRRRLGLGLGGGFDTAGDGEGAAGGGGGAVSGCGVLEASTGRGEVEADAEGGQLALAALTVLRLLVQGTAMTQAHVAYGGLGVVLGALDALPYHVGVQVAGMELLAELVEGEDAAHEAIRQQLLEAGALRRAVAAMREHTDWGEVAAVGGGRGGRRRGAGREEVAEEQPLLPAAMRLLGTLLLDKLPPKLHHTVAAELRRTRLLQLLRGLIAPNNTPCRTSRAGPYGTRCRSYGFAATQAALLKLEARVVELVAARGVLGDAGKWMAAALGEGGKGQACGGSLGVGPWKLVAAAGGVGFAVGASVGAMAYAAMGGW